VPTTHDYRDNQRCEGHDLTYEPLPESKLKATGWGAHEPKKGGHFVPIQVGDFLLLTNKDRGSDTRYAVETIKYFSDPYDMWTGTLSFAPR
jgi:hypothetical protein